MAKAQTNIHVGDRKIVDRQVETFRVSLFTSKKANPVLPFVAVHIGADENATLFFNSSADVQALIVKLNTAKLALKRRDA